MLISYLGHQEGTLLPNHVEHSMVGQAGRDYHLHYVALDLPLGGDKHTQAALGADNRDSGQVTQTQDLVTPSFLHLWPVQSAIEFHKEGSGHPNMKII